MVYQEQPGVWKLIAEPPRFFLVLGYRLQCMDIFIDAVKHLSGCMAFGCMLRPHVFRLNAPSDLALNGCVPASIITLIDKASKEIEAHYLDTLDRLNDTLDPPLSPGSEEGLLQHIACYRIAKFLHGHIIGSQCHPGDFGDEEVTTWPQGHVSYGRLRHNSQNVGGDRRNGESRGYRLDSGTKRVLP